MKKWVYVLLTTITIVFAGCYEISEDIVIGSNGAGTYRNKMDMGGLIQMMQYVAGAEDLSQKGLDRAIDTVISLNSVMDKADDLSADEKKLFSDGTMHLQLNIQESLLKTDMNIPFRSQNDLQKLMSGASGGGFSSAFRKIFSDKNSESASPMDNQGMDQLSGIFDFVMKDGVFSRKVNDEKLKALMARPEMAQMDQVSGLGIEIPYSSTIKFPRPIKKSDNALVKLSDDKKTATVRFNLMDLFEHPEKFSYTIEY